MINTQFLHETAKFVDTRVAKVVINESHEITDFEVKAVTDNVLALNYIVPVSEVSQITKIELRDSANNQITVNDVDVPIASDTLMLQTIEVKEVMT